MKVTLDGSAWNRGTWWKALLFIAAYWGVYELIGLGIGTLFGGVINLTNPLADPLTAFLMLALPILIAGILLFLFARSLGWVKKFSAPSPSEGKLGCGLRFPSSSSLSSCGW